MVQNDPPGEGDFTAFKKILDPEASPDTAETIIPLIWKNLDPLETGFINFAGYMYVRKVHLAWKKCALDSELSSKDMACAIYITCPTRPMGLPAAN